MDLGTPPSDADTAAGNARGQGGHAGSADVHRDESALPDREPHERRSIQRSLTLTVIGGDQPPLSVASGTVTIGFEPGCDLTLVSASPISGRVDLTVDQDGAMLRLGRSSFPVRLNQRPVESLAFLHDGDVLDIGGYAVTVLFADDSASATSEAGDRSTRVRRVPPKFVLRGTAGSRFGKLIPIYGRLVIGRDDDCDLVLNEAGLSRRHAIIETLPEGLFLRDLGSANGSYVNGTRVRDSALHHGDQIVLDSVRFQVQSIEQLDTAADHEAVTAPHGQGSTNHRRLLAAAAVIVAAGAAAALLLLR